jgi:hypothetical protein
LLFGILMVPTHIEYGERHTDTRISATVVMPPGAYKDGLINAVKGMLRAATDEVRIESLDVSHEEQLRGGRDVVHIAVQVPRSPKEGEDQTKAHDIVKMDLWLSRPGILGDDFAYMTEGVDLVKLPEYSKHRRYLRAALNPYGENDSPKRATGKSYSSALFYYPPVVVIIAFQPEELDADYTNSGLARRFVTLVAQPGPDFVRRIAHRSILGKLDPIHDMGVYDTMPKNKAEAFVLDQLHKVGRRFWGRPYNRWTLDPTKPEEAEFARRVHDLEDKGALDSRSSPLSLDEAKALEQAMKEIQVWTPRAALRLTEAAQREMQTAFDIVMDDIEDRDGVARQYGTLMETTVVGLLARMAGITAGVRIANGIGKTQVEPEDVLACALDLQDFLDMGLALILDRGEASFRKTVHDDVVWVCQSIANCGGIMRSTEAKTAYNAEQPKHNGWRLWDRVRKNLRELGLVEPPPKGASGQEVPLKLTDSGLSMSVAGAKPLAKKFPTPED